MRQLRRLETASGDCCGSLPNEQEPHTNVRVNEKQDWRTVPTKGYRNTSITLSKVGSKGTRVPDWKDYSTGDGKSVNVN